MFHKRERFESFVLHIVQFGIYLDDTVSLIHDSVFLFQLLLLNYVSQTLLELQHKIIQMLVVDKAKRLI